MRTPIQELLYPNHDSRGVPLHWGRSDIDGLPFRGAEVPMYTEDEFEQRCRPVGEPNCRLFEVTDPQQQAEYLAVLRSIVNGRASALHRSAPTVEAATRRVFVYLEWVDNFIQDVKPAPHGYARHQEVAVNGLGTVPAHSGRR